MAFRKRGRKNFAAANFQTEPQRPSSCTTNTPKRAMLPAACASKMTRATSSSIASQADHQKNESFTKKYLTKNFFQLSRTKTIHKFCLSFFSHNTVLSHSFITVTIPHNAVFSSIFFKSLVAKKYF